MKIEMGKLIGLKEQNGQLKEQSMDAVRACLCTLKSAQENIDATKQMEQQARLMEKEQQAQQQAQSMEQVRVWLCSLKSAQ